MCGCGCWCGCGCGCGYGCGCGPGRLCRHFCNHSRRHTRSGVDHGGDSTPASKVWTLDKTIMGAPQRPYSPWSMMRARPRTAEGTRPLASACPVPASHLQAAGSPAGLGQLGPPWPPAGDDRAAHGLRCTLSHSQGHLRSTLSRHAATVVRAQRGQQALGFEPLDAHTEKYDGRGDGDGELRRAIGEPRLKGPIRHHICTNITGHFDR